MTSPDLDELDPRLAALLAADEVPNVAPQRRARIWRRVQATIEEPEVRPRWGLWALAVVALAAVVLAWVFWGGRTPVTGQLQPAERTTVAIGDRAVAVAEAGSSLRWTEATVTQDLGAVFYRVDDGPPFVVESPAGTVRVVGTSFEVEVSDVKTQWKSAGVGAAIAAAVVVTVYEGKVVLANEAGTVEIEAGQRAEAAAGEAPTAATARRGTDDVRVAIAAADESSEAQAELIRSLRSRVAELEALAPDPEKEAADRNRGHAEHSQRLFDPTPEQLLEDAENCRVRYYLVPIEMHGDPPKLADEAKFADVWAKLDLTEQEEAAINAFYAEVNTELVPLMRELYIEATGDEAGAENLSYRALAGEIRAKSDDLDARRQVTAERAGLEPPSDDPSTDSPAARYHRAHFEVTRRYNDLLMSFGKERGEAIRSRMPIRQTSYGSCDREGL